MLEKITVTECPECGTTRVVSEHRSRFNTNDSWEEYRKFSCDYAISYNRYLDKLVVKSSCNRCKNARDRIDSEKLFFADLKAHIQKKVKNYKYKLDPGFNSRISSILDTIKYYM